VNITLDCNVYPDFDLTLLTADYIDADNSIDDPLAVSPIRKKLTGADQTFIYNAPANSLSVLKLIRRI
jgi:alpha-L-arabinofuranosidase